MRGLDKGSPERLEKLPGLFSVSCCIAEVGPVVTICAFGFDVDLSCPVLSRLRRHEECERWIPSGSCRRRRTKSGPESRLPGRAGDDSKVRLRLGFQSCEGLGGSQTLAFWLSCLASNVTT